MKKTVLSILFVLILFMVPLGMALVPSGGMIVEEKREKAAFPAFPDRITSNRVKKYFAAIDRYIIDHFPTRSSLIGLNTFIVNKLGDNVAFDRAYHGKDGWLFLGNDYNKTVDKMTGKLVLTDAIIDQNIKKFTRYSKFFTDHNVEMMFIIGPNKDTIYPEKLPFFIKPAKSRYIMPLLERFREKGIKVYDPTAELIAKKAENLLYLRTDTHWNLKAGEIVSSHIIKEWGLQPSLPYRLEPADSFKGDLVSIGLFENIQLRRGDNFGLKWLQNPEGATFSEDGIKFMPFNMQDTKMPDKGQVIRFQGATNDKKLWVVGDSFTHSLQLFLFGAFKEVKLFHYGKISAEELEKQFNATPIADRPNYIIFEMVERVL